MPSIRENGYYELQREHKIKINELNSKLDEKEQQIRILENNQATKHITKRKYIYIIKSADNKKITFDTTKIYKLGKTIKFNARMNTINTSTKDNASVLYRTKIDDISAVENCLKGILSKQVYRTNKEHYIITLKEALKIIKKCVKLTKSNIISEDKYYKKYIFRDKTTDNTLSWTKYNVLDQCINFVINNNIQKGGNIINTYNDIIKLYTLNKNIYNMLKNINEIKI